MILQDEVEPTVRAAFGYLPLRWRAVLVADVELWCCDHLHRSRARAEECADRAYRGLPQSCAVNPRAARRAFR